MGKRRVPGTKLLRTWCEEQGLSLAALAERIGCSKAMAGFLRAGDLTPGLELAARIATATGGKVPMASWVAAPRAQKRADA